MKSQTTIGKAFEINKNPNIYGTFAEIGAGQETVNFFYKAGLASQTVAKSMSAYDMTFSDDIYGKQTRYVCKNRLSAMLDHEYRLLEKRLKRKLGQTHTFFAFATTAVTRTRKTESLFSNSQHAWMGLRFQTKALQNFNDVIFRVNCLDRTRLGQHEALGILGANLIYSCFYCRDTPKKFISSLTENLPISRIEIHAMSCTGPTLTQFSPQTVNLEILSHNLNPLVFFPQKDKSEFLTDSTFDKSLFIFYGNTDLIKNINKKNPDYLQSLHTPSKDISPIFFIPKNDFRKESSLKNYLKQIEKEKLSILTTNETPLEKLKEIVSLYTIQPITFIIDEDYFTKNMFSPSFYKKKSILSTLGRLFDKNTKIIVFSKKKNFSVKDKVLPYNQEQILKNYLVEKKQILDI